MAKASNEDPLPELQYTKDEEVFCIYADERGPFFWTWILNDFCFMKRKLLKVFNRNTNRIKNKRRKADLIIVLYEILFCSYKRLLLNDNNIF